MDWLIRQLRAPFPEPEGPMATLRVASLSGIFVACFLMLFQPFGLSSDHIPNKYLILSIFGLITFLVLLINELLLRPLLPLSGTRLVFWKWLIWTSWLILSIAIGNFLYVSWLFEFEGATWTVFGRFCFYTLAVGIFPAGIIGWINSTKRSKNHLAEAKNMQEHLHAQPKVNSAILISASEGRSELEVDLQDLLYLESQDNYVLVHFLVSGHVKKELIRSTLTFQEKKHPNSGLIRCHRSYMVNLRPIEKVEGNAQGLKLFLSGLDKPIPVSRKYIQSVKTALEAMG